MAVKITKDGIDTIQNNTVNAQKIQDNSITPSNLHAGACVQVVQSLYTPRTSYTVYTSDTDVPGGTITITPKGNNSKFLIMVRYLTEVSSNWDVVYNVLRDGSRINMGGLNNIWSGLSMGKQTYSSAANDDSTPEVVNFRTLDTTGSTAGTPITFKLVSSAHTNRTVYLNRTFGSDGQTNYENSTSEFIIMEMKG